MSVIAINGVPVPWSLISVVKVLAKAVNGHFEALNFEHVKGGKEKICYLRLSERLDPVRVVESINRGVYKFIRPFAYIPDHVPDLPLSSKPKKIPLKLRQALRLPEEDLPKVLTMTNTELMNEIQLKYAGLYNLSKKTSHNFLTELAKATYKRLKLVAQQNPNACDSGFKLSQCYRRVHPHAGDFQFMQDTLHALEDIDGKPHTQLQEKQLLTLPPNPFVFDNAPYGTVQEACNNYSERIIKKVSQHVKDMDLEITEADTEDEISRKKVRNELKKMTPFLPLIVRQVVTAHFMPAKKNTYYRIRIYGEPFLPSKDIMSPFLNRFKPDKMNRSKRMYNMLRFNVSPLQFIKLMDMDGTEIGGAKLVIRSMDLPHHKVPTYSIKGEVPDEEFDEMDEEQEQWNEL